MNFFFKKNSISTPEFVLEGLAFITVGSFLFLWDYASIKIDLRPIIFIWLILYCIYNFKYFQVTQKKILIIPTFLLCHLLFANILYGFVLSSKAIASIFLVYTSLFFAYIYRSKVISFIFRFADLFFILNFLVQVGELIGFIDISTHSSNFISIFPRRTGLLNEPSHLALVYGPFLGAYFFDPQSYKKYISKKSIFAAVCSLFIAPSSTLLIVIFLSLLLYFFYKKTYRIKILLFILLFIFLVIATKNHPTSFYNKFSFILNSFINFSDLKIMSSDISVLVFLSHFETLNYSLKHFPLGVGFNQYDYVRNLFISNTPNIDSFYPISALNHSDASSTFIKFFSELGFLSILIFLYLIKFLFFKFKPSNFINLYFFLLFSASVFRGVGYFSAGFILCFSLLILQDGK